MAEKYAKRTLVRMPNGTLGVVYVDTYSGKRIPLDKIDDYKIITAGNKFGVNFGGGGDNDKDKDKDKDKEVEIDKNKGDDRDQGETDGPTTGKSPIPRDETEEGTAGPLPPNTVKDSPGIAKGWAERNKLYSYNEGIPASLRTWDEPTDTDTPSTTNTAVNQGFVPASPVSADVPAGLSPLSDNSAGLAPSNNLTGPSGKPVTGVIDAGAGWTTVQYSDGTSETREGVRSDRNNNPGNVEYGGYAKQYGAVGTDGRFAVFSTPEEGKKAAGGLIFDKYGNVTLAEAITKYAPPTENNTRGYIDSVAKKAGITPNTPVQSLTQEQRDAVLGAMFDVETGANGNKYSRQYGIPATSLPQDPTVQAEVPQQDTPGLIAQAPIDRVNTTTTNSFKLDDPSVYGTLPALDSSSLGFYNAPTQTVGTVAVDPSTGGLVSPGDFGDNFNTRNPDAGNYVAPETLDGNDPNVAKINDQVGLSGTNRFGMTIDPNNDDSLGTGLTGTAPTVDTTGIETHDPQSDDAGPDDSFQGDSGFSSNWDEDADPSGPNGQVPGGSVGFAGTETGFRSGPTAPSTPTATGSTPTSGFVNVETITETAPSTPSQSSVDNSPDDRDADDGTGGGGGWGGWL